MRAGDTAMQSSREKVEVFVKRSTREQIVQRIYELSLGLEYAIKLQLHLPITKDILEGTATQGRVILLENTLNQWPD